MDDFYILSKHLQDNAYAPDPSELVPINGDTLGTGIEIADSRNYRYHFIKIHKDGKHYAKLDKVSATISHYPYEEAYLNINDLNPWDGLFEITGRSVI